VSAKAGAAAVVCLDLDGVIWRGDEPIAPAIAGAAALRAAGLQVAFLSNNSSVPVGGVVDKLRGMGVEAEPHEVITSALAAAHLLRRDLPAGTRVLVCGGPGVYEALAAEELTAVDEGPADAVVVGLNRGFTYDVLAKVSAAVRDGARFVATNLDNTYPVPGGLIPGAGSIVAAVAAASGGTPEVAGKPARPTADLVWERFGPTGVMVGDRPSTDGAMADTLGWPFALVLSGVTAAVAPPGGEAIPVPAPPFVAADLGQLVEPLVASLRHS
jgi:HAD superfamily hydrolase (TIGR01450 family)